MGSSPSFLDQKSDVGASVLSADSPLTGNPAANVNMATVRTNAHKVVAKRMVVLHSCAEGGGVAVLEAAAGGLEGG
jgi:hypothetical protein